MMNSPEIEIEEAFEKGEIVTVCWDPECLMHRLPHWDEGRWIAHESKKGYRNYSHGICRFHFRMYQREIERYMAAEAAAPAA